MPRPMLMREKPGAQTTRPYIWPSSLDRKVSDHANKSRVDTDRERLLVERARQGDKDAYGELYRLCHGVVSRLVRFHLPGPAGEDAVAETFLRAWTALPRYKDTGAPFAAWLGGIARHVVADTLRAARRVEPRAEVPDRPVEFQGRLDDQIILADAVARLPREQRIVIELKFLMGWRNEDVAKALGKSVGAVNAMQWRALEKLKGMLGSR